MKKTISLLCALALFISLCALPVNAETVLNEEDIIYIETSSQEEYDQVIAEIEANNQKVNELWEEALLESEKDENKIPEGNLLSTRSSSYRVVEGNFQDAHYVCSGAVTRNQYGQNLWSSIYGISMYSINLNKSFSLNYYNTTLIDGRRTCAANISQTVGVKDIWGNYSYYSWMVYAEFYTSGGTYFTV